MKQLKRPQKRILTPPVIIAPLPGSPETSLRLISRTTRFHNVLPAEVDLLKRGVPCERREVLSVEDLLSVVAELWRKGVGETPSSVRLAVFLSKMLTQLFPAYSAEIPDEINRVIRSLPRMRAGRMIERLDTQRPKTPPKDLKARLIELESWVDWGFWDLVMSYHALDEFSACWPYHST